MGRLSTQTIEVWSEENPLDIKYVTVPVKKDQKIFCHEPYVLEALKMYEGYTSEEVMSAINTYEANSFRDICEGVVEYISKDSATICLSGKHSVLVDVKGESTLETGTKIDVVVNKSKGRFNADATSKAAQLEVLKQELVKQIQTPTSAYVGIVKEVIYNASNTFNGFIVDINGVKCFMPGSESDVVPLNDYNALVGESLYVMPIAISKDSIVVSHKEYLNTLKGSVIDKLESLEKGAVISGEVSSVKHFGVFILIEKCVPTLLSVSEMNEVTEAKFKSGELKIGDSLDFYVDSVNGERVVITQTASKSEGWENLKNEVEKNKDYKLKGIVKNLFDNGVVILSQEFNNITFFLSAKVVELDKLSIGQEVELPVSSVDTVKKTVRLNIE